MRKKNKNTFKEKFVALEECSASTAVAALKRGRKLWTLWFTLPTQITGLYTVSQNNKDCIKSTQSVVSSE